MSHYEDPEWRDARLAEEAAHEADQAAIRRAVWAAIEGRTFTLDWLELVIGRLAENMAGYLSRLMAEGYVVLACIRRPESGELQPVFSQRIRRGSTPPYLDENGLRLIDPHAPDPATAVKRPEFPSMSARLRVAAEGMPPEFSMQELRDEVFNGEPPDEGMRNRFAYSWSSLRTGREINACGNGNYRFEMDRDIALIREHLKANAGWPLTSAAIGKALGLGVIRGPRIREACDLLAAEGYRVTIMGQKLGKTRGYMVELDNARS